jgi:hypothetical protein
LILTGDASYLQPLLLGAVWVGGVSHGSSSLLLDMRVMARHFVSDSHKVMTSVLWVSEVATNVGGLPGKFFDLVTAVLRKLENQI